MTRNEFLDNVNDWYDLIDFCNDMGCEYCEDVYSEDCRDDYINECLMDWAHDSTRKRIATMVSSTKSLWRIATTRLLRTRISPLLN